MTEYDNRNKGIIGKNDRKTTDTHPDITGSLNVDGVDYFIDGWRKERRDGSGSFYSLSVKRKDKQASAPTKPAAKYPGERGGLAQELDDEIPF